MTTRHLEADQWLNRKEWRLGSGRQRQLSQDQKDRVWTMGGAHNFFPKSLKEPLPNSKHVKGITK
jgi:hypothetical protein